MNTSEKTIGEIVADDYRTAKVFEIPSWSLTISSRSSRTISTSMCTLKTISFS